MNLVVLISGKGSNLKSLIENLKDAKFKAIISNNPNAQGLKYAAEVNAESIVIDHRDFNNRLDFDKKLIKTIKKIDYDLIVLAGFMRILSNDFVKCFTGKIINIHPSLLPKYKGLNTHQRVLENKEKYHGATVHFVNQELDGGKIILQDKIEVLPNDTKESLKNKVLEVEHRIYSKAIRNILEKP